MEAKLFFISLWCGLYGLIIRQTQKRETFRNSVALTSVLNGLFWGTSTFLASLLYTSYTEQSERLTSASIAYFSVGFILGLIVTLKRARQEEKRKQIMADNLEWADTGFSAILLASVVMFFVVQAFKIPSGSMRMTFVEGDHLFVNKFIYGIPVPFTDKKVIPFKPVAQKDIVIFRFPSNDPDSPHYGKDFIKRVIATEGQTVQVVNKVVSVDGINIDEPYKQHVDDDIVADRVQMSSSSFQEVWESRMDMGPGIRDNFGPVVVPAGDVFVMGDNRDRSFDGRFWGPLPLKAIKGKAWLLYWPFSRFKVAR